MMICQILVLGQNTRGVTPMQKLFKSKKREKKEKRDWEKMDKCPRYLKQWVLRCPPEKKRWIR